MQGSEQRAAYTTVRSDICGLVPSNAMSILDVGCSNGALGSALMRMVPGRTVAGIENDPLLCSEARNVLTHVTQADLESFEWTYQPSGAYDCIVFADVLEHLSDPDAHLSGAKHCLTAGGCVIVSFPNIRHLTALYSIFIRGTFPRRDRGLFDRTHLRWFTLRDMQDSIHRCGYRIVAIDGSLRVKDRGGGFSNKVANRMPDPIRHAYLVREFFTYQYCIRATAA